MPLVVSVGFVPPSIVAVSFGRLGLTEQIGRVGRLAIRPGGPLVPCGRALVPAPLGALVVVVGHSTGAYFRKNPHGPGRDRTYDRWIMSPLL